MYQLPSSYPDSSNFSYILYHAYVARMANTWWPLIPVLTNTAKWHRGHQLKYHTCKNVIFQAVDVTCLAISQKLV